MPLEPSVTHIADLNPAWPAAADPKSDGDDHIRNQKKALLNDFAGFTGGILCTGTDGGAANAYTVTPTTSQALPAYGLRMGVVFSPVAANTGACTLTIGALSAKPLRAVDGTDLVAGDLAAGAAYDAVYTGTEFRLRAPTKNYIDAVRAYAAQLAFSTALPQQSGNGGKFLTTDGTSAFWAITQTIARSARSSNTPLAAADKTSFVDITANTFTQTFAAAAALGAGWWCYYRNAGSGDITLDPNGAELIDGLTSYVMYPGEARLVICDGTGFYTIVLHPFSKVFTASGSFIRPPGYKQYGGFLWGAGGSGGKSSGIDVAAGAGGGCAPFTLPATGFGASDTVTIGAGGTAVAVTSNGNAGGLSSFAGITAGGGQGGINGAVSAQGGAAFGSANPIAAASADAYLAGGGSNIPSKTVYGGALGGLISSNTPIAAGTTIFGGVGGACGTTTSGVDGTAPGGGGGATQTGAQSGAGARGELRIFGVA